jgi:hypothetical protein
MKTKVQKCPLCGCKSHRGNLNGAWFNYAKCVNPNCKWFAKWIEYEIWNYLSLAVQAAEAHRYFVWGKFKRNRDITRARRAFLETRNAFAFEYERRRKENQ